MVGILLTCRPTVAHYTYHRHGAHEPHGAGPKGVQGEKAMPLPQREIANVSRSAFVIFPLVRDVLKH